MTEVQLSHVVISSINLDSWSRRQLTAMSLGGHDNFNAFLIENPIDPGIDKNRKDECYESNSCHRYRNLLKHKVDEAIKGNF